MWGSNAREAHPIFFHHVLKGIRNGAKMYAVDPRRSSTAKWADAWLGIHVGSDISLANAIANEIITAGLVDEEFIRRATVEFRGVQAEGRASTRSSGPSATPACPRELIRQLAHDYARADRAQICWTLGITEHHNAADNVLALINLSLLTGHVGRYGSGLVPLRGQNNVQGGGDMGAIPNKLTGFQDIELDHDARRRFGEKYGVTIHPKKGMHLSQMFDAMERGELTCAYVIGENPMSSEADTHHTRKMLEGLECLVVQDIVLTDTAKAADVVLPGTASWCESEGTVTNSERRVQRVRKAIDPPDGARDDIWIITRARPAARQRLGQPDPRGPLGRAAHALAHAPRHELREARAARRRPVALPGRGVGRHPVPARPAVGGGPGQARHPRPVPPGGAGRPARHAHRRVPDQAHHRPPPRLLQHRRGRAASSPPRCGGRRR